VTSLSASLSGTMTRERDETQLTSGRRGAGNPPAAHSLAGQSSDAGLLVIALLSLVGLILLTVAVARSVVFPFDQPLLTLMHGWDGAPIIWNTISQGANIPLIVIGLAFVLWLFFTNRRREALVVVLMLVAVTAGSEGVKQLVGRPRPSGNGDGIPGVVYSYPSGHVLEVLTILGSIALRAWRSARRLALRGTLVALVALDVVLVAIARIALAEHYPTDVLAGFLGAIGALAVYALLTRPGGWANQTGADSEDVRGSGHEPQVTSPGSRSAADPVGRDAA
jgi:undecaprenyl-diphosphatase